MKTLLSLLFLTTAGAISAKAHHANPYIDAPTANNCIQQIGIRPCTCIEHELARGNNGLICIIPVIPASQQPMYDFWSNPYSNQGIQAPNITF